MNLASYELQDGITVFHFRFKLERWEETFKHRCPLARLQHAWGPWIVWHRHLALLQISWLHLDPRSWPSVSFPFAYSCPTSADSQWLPDGRTCCSLDWEWCDGWIPSLRSLWSCATLSFENCFDQSQYSLTNLGSMVWADLLEICLWPREYHWN